MRVLFLDIDGVLNSDRWIASRGFDVAKEPWQDIDPNAITVLNRVVSTTGCGVVLSSDWRRAPRKPGLLGTQSALYHVGATFQLLGCTPILTDAKRLDRFGDGLHSSYVGRWRWMECQVWLDEHPEVDAFAIVDDGGDFGLFAHRLVQTDPMVGLTDADAERLIALLTESQ